MEDLVNTLDTGEPPRGGMHGTVPRDNMHLIFGFVESFARGGQKVQMPDGQLKDHGHWRLEIGDDVVSILLNGSCASGSVRKRHSLCVACTQLLDPDRRLPSFTRDMALERQGRDGSADDATDEELAEAAGVLATAETARL